MKTLAEFLNEFCNCRTIDQTKAENSSEKFLLNESGVFSDTSYFLDEKNLSKIKRFISLIYKITEFESKNHKSNQIFNSTNPGFLLAFDFHISSEGPKLIEINTNPGGFLLSGLHNQKHLCNIEKNSKKICFQVNENLDFPKEVIKIIKNEWELAVKNEDMVDLKNVAIVDKNPKNQFLYKEFLLYQNIFNQYGINCWIVSSEEFYEKNGKLFYNEVQIDLVYNRLTDFYLEESEIGIQAIKNCYKNHSIVLTPNPYSYLVFSDKKNLIRWSDSNYLETINLEKNEIKFVQKMIPKTNHVRSFDFNNLWENRKKYFFKPLNGFGSRGVYRGEKITKNVFQKIIQEEYLVQDFIPASTRIITNEKKTENIKIKSDIRVFVYDAEIVSLTSRLYQGQVTSLNTPGGGFAPVMVLPNLKSNFSDLPRTKECNAIKNIQYICA